MKSILLSVLSFLFCVAIKANQRDSTVHYNLPDSVKAVQFMAEINIQAINGKKEVLAGIKTDVVQLALKAGKRRVVVFDFPGSAIVMAKGLNAEAGSGSIEFEYNWATNETYKLMISMARDSAENFSLYSGYAWLAMENKWKLVGTCKIQGRWNTIQDPTTFFSSEKKEGIQVTMGAVWCQGSNGSWKNMKEDEQPIPVVNLYPHIDSIAQLHIEKTVIEEAIASGKTNVKEEVEGVYYHIIKEGTGRPIAVTDTVVAFYKGYLFNGGLIFDQTKDKPATFPLNRLIKGWQTGVSSSCKVGGKIKLVIPSNLAYSIRTRAAKIPPNSILVFEIEVMEARSLVKE